MDGFQGARDFEMPSGEKPVFVCFRVITRDVPSFICSTLPCHSVNPRLL